MPRQSEVTMTRLSRAVATRLAGAAAVLKITGRDRQRRAVDALLNLAMDQTGVPEHYAPTEVECMDARRLAVGLSRPLVYVAAMRNAGYRFRFGRTTTLPHALEWLRQHPEFSGQLSTPQITVAVRPAEN